jgi:hypothetical protein
MLIIFCLPYFLLGIVSFQGVDNKMLVGKWETIRVDYLDQDPLMGKEGQNIIFEFKEDGTCINHEFGSHTAFSTSGRIVDMGGYKIIVEKLTDLELVFREQKDFFIRRFFCKRIIEESTPSE